MTRLPKIGSGRLVENNAELATRKQDFNAHAEGGGFRHDATMIDMNPPLTGSLADPVVQGTLEKFQSYLQGLDYVTIGDGNVSVGDFTVGTVETPTVNDCFDAAFALTQMAKGGIILLKPGLYVFNQTVELPAGVGVIGHSGSTILSSGPGLVIGAKPLFKVPASSNLVMTNTGLTTDGYAASFFSNLMFVDNYTTLAGGGSCYLGEANSSFIEMNNDSKLIIRDCVVAGKATQGANAANTSVTTRFIRLNNTIAGSGAVLDIQNCIIHGVQKVATFISLSATYNSLKFINNRVLCLFKTNPPTTNYILEFSACNSELCNNTFKFSSMNTSADPTRGICYKVLGSTASDIVVTGNTIDQTSLSPLALKNQIIEFDTGTNIRSKISNNSTGGVSDSNWYITVGDGINSVGDINGSGALNVISNIFTYSMSGYQVPGQSNLADQITIFIRPGEYEINRDFNVKGIGAKLIGLKENENLPRISIATILSPDSTTGWYMDTTDYIILGTHLENLFFSTNSSTYKRIACPIYFANVDSQEVFGNKFIAKNCYFYNVGVIPRLASVDSVSYDVNKNKPIDIVFDTCRFGSTTSGSYTTWEAVLIIGFKADYYFRNCTTEKNTSSGIRFAGRVITSTQITAPPLPRDANGKPNITIDNCNFAVREVGMTYSWGGSATSWMRLSNVGNLTLKNSTFDISSTTSTFSQMIYANGDTGNTILVDNCSIIGNNAVPTSSPTTGCSGFYITGAPVSLIVSNNEFKGLANSLRCINQYTPADSHSFIIENNRCTFSSRSSSFVSLRNDITSNKPFNAVIKDNIINCSAAVSADMLGYPSGWMTNGIIDCTCSPTPRPLSSISIENNKIQSAKTGTAITKIQSAISIKGFQSVDVSKNTISMTRTGAIDGYVIDCQMVESFTTYGKSDDSFFKANGNHITYTTATAIGTNIVAPIYARNIHYVNIKDNTILISDINIANYIRVLGSADETALTDPIYTPRLMDGVVENNIFNRTLKYEPTWVLLYPSGSARSALDERKEVLVHNESLIGDSRIRVENNKNQKAKYDISCTKFKQYGFNTQLPSATILLKDADLIQSDSHSSNLNRHAERIMQQYAILGLSAIYAGGQGSATYWDSLPSGLYYTNAWRTPEDGYGARDPMVEFALIDGISRVLTYHCQNQILIPMSGLPRDCEILNIDIPIYLQNLSSTVTISVDMSASFIFGNNVFQAVSSAPETLLTDYMKYMPDTTTWRSVSVSLDPKSAATSGKLRLLNYNNFNTSLGSSTIVDANTNSSWLEDSNTRLISSPEMYILLSINRVNDDTISPPALEGEDYLAFAIPYARVTLRY